MSRSKLHFKNNSLYYYQAEVVNIVDGDTIDAKVDLGFNTFVIKRFRVLDLDTAETWRPRNEAERRHGELAKQKAKELLLDKTILIRTGKEKGFYGRYLCEIFLENGELYSDFMKSHGFEKKEHYDE